MEGIDGISQHRKRQHGNKACTFEPDIKRHYLKRQYEPAEAEYDCQDIYTQIALVIKSRERNINEMQKRSLVVEYVLIKYLS